MPDKPAATDVDPPTLPAASPDQPSANTAQLSASADEHMLIDSLADFVNTNPNFFDALLLADFSQQQQQQHVPAPQMDEAMQAAVALVQHQSTPVGEVLPSLDAFELDAADPNSTAVFDELLFAQHHSHQSYRQQQHRASEQQESSPAASNTSTRRSILKCERPPDYLLRVRIDTVTYTAALLTFFPSTLPAHTHLVDAEARAHCTFHKTIVIAPPVHWPC